MREYAAYKDLGVEWIGEIPVHWDFLRMKNAFTFGKGLNITKADLVDEGIPVVSYGQIHSKNNTGVHMLMKAILTVENAPLYLWEIFYSQIHLRIITALVIVCLLIIKETYLLDTIL